MRRGLLRPQVGFFDEKCRRYVTVARKDTALLNRLEKTKQERQPNFKAEKEVMIGLLGVSAGEALPQAPAVVFA